MRLALKKRLPVAVTVSPEDPRPREIAGYFGALVARMAEHPEPMRVAVRFAVPEKGFSYPDEPPRVVLDFDPKDGRPFIRVGAHRAKFDAARLWIPDHPVPIALPCALLADPTGDGRFRVRETRLGAWARRAQAVFGRAGGAS